MNYPSNLVIRQHYGCYGNDSVKTPNIDFMAREGVQFQTAWATAICSPTRAMIMTGRYANQTGFYHNNLYVPQNGETKDLHKYHHSFAKLMKQTGYATAIAGKWHLGKGRNHQPDQQGYEFSAVINGPHLPGKYRVAGRPELKPKP